MTERGHRYKVGKMAMNKYLSIITLNVSELNVPIRRHRVAEWIRKYDPNERTDQNSRKRTK